MWCPRHGPWPASNRIPLGASALVTAEAVSMPRPAEGSRALMSTGFTDL